MTEQQKRRPPCKRYLEIFTLVEIHGKSYAEVAAELGLKPGTVREACSCVRAWIRRMRERYPIPIHSPSPRYSGERAGVRG